MKRKNSGGSEQDKVTLGQWNTLNEMDSTSPPCFYSSISSLQYLTAKDKECEVEKNWVLRLSAAEAAAGKTDCIGHTSWKRSCGTPQLQLLIPASEAQHVALSMWYHHCCSGPWSEPFMLLFRAQLGLFFVFVSWRSTRGLISWEWGYGQLPALVEWYLETSLRCKAEKAASDFCPPQMSTRESISYSTSNVLAADLKKL